MQMHEMGEMGAVEILTRWMPENRSASGRLISHLASSLLAVESWVPIP